MSDDIQVKVPVSFAELRFAIDTVGEELGQEWLSKYLDNSVFLIKYCIETIENEEDVKARWMDKLADNTTDFHVGMSCAIFILNQAIEALEGSKDDIVDFMMNEVTGEQSHTDGEPGSGPEIPTRH